MERPTETAALPGASVTLPLRDPERPTKHADSENTKTWFPLCCLTISSSAAKRKERERLTMSPLQRGVRLHPTLTKIGTGSQMRWPALVLDGGAWSAARARLKALRPGWRAQLQR